MALEDGQLSINGITLGDDENTFMSEMTGWDDLPPVESGNSPKPMAHGSFSGSKYARERIITWTGTLNPKVLSEFSSRLAAIRAATTISDIESEITIRTIDEELVCFGSPTARAIPGNRRYGAAKAADISIQFTCSDPRKYTVDSTLISIGFPTSGGSGLTYPLDYPLDYGVAAEAAIGEFFNEGDASLPVKYTITGPLTDPTIYLEESGFFISFTITLTSSDVLIIDTLEGSVQLNGTADRLYTRSTGSSPIAAMELMPGVNNIRVSAGSWSDTANVQVSGRSGAFF